MTAALAAVSAAVMVLAVALVVSNLSYRRRMAQVREEATHEDTSPTPPGTSPEASDTSPDPAGTSSVVGAPSEPAAADAGAGAQETQGEPRPHDMEVMLQALWQLTNTEQRWMERDAAALTTAAPTTLSTAAASEADRLGMALKVNVSRIREETGTPGSVDVVFVEEPHPADALLLLRTVQVLLVSLARHSQAYDLYVHELDSRMSATIVLADFDGPSTVVEDAAEVLDAISLAGGDLEVDRDKEGRLRAHISFPAIGSCSDAGGRAAPASQEEGSEN